MKRLPTLATNPLRLPLEPPTHLDTDQHRGHGEHTVCHGEATALRFFFFLSQRTNERPVDRGRRSILPSFLATFYPTIVLDAETRTRERRNHRRPTTSETRPFGPLRD